MTSNPKFSHMRVVVCNQAVRMALGFVPEVEELVLEFLTPDGMERTLLEELIPLETDCSPVSYNTQPSPTSADNIYCRAS